MEFEWDEPKRRAVLTVRGLDFRRADLFFDGRLLLTMPSDRGDEARWLSVGDLDGRLIAVVWCLREDHIRIISMRRARHEEERKYRTLYGG